MPSRLAVLAASTSALVLALPLAADAGAAQPNDGRDDRADTRHGALVARDAHAASALAARPAFTATSSGYRGRSDGWDDIKADGRLDRRTSADRKGNVAQVGQTTLTGRPACSGTASPTTATASRAPARRGGIGKDDTFVTHGRAWPIFAGERGEYALQAGDPAGAAAGLRAMAGTANDGLMLPEQAWDGRRPTGTQGRKLGENTLSATPLAWSHAQYVRLAWSLARGAPVEQPAVVACRYTGRGCG